MKSKSAPRNCNLAARAAVFLAIGSSAILAVPSRAQSYDLVINGGRVMDPETMFDDIDTGLDAMKDRGRVQVGKVADLTLFDPKTARDNATYKVGESGLPSTGIPYVIVNGAIVVKNSEVLPIKPGQPIRFPPEARGRFEPVELNKWLGAHSINVPDMHEADDSGAAQMNK